MNGDKKISGGDKSLNPTQKPGSPRSAGAGRIVVPPFFRKIDWLTFGITAFVVFVGYMLTAAPEVTLEDSGELATGSFYAGVPHPPGYPLWTVYTWFFTLLPLGNVAYRVGVGVALSGALSAGLLAMITSRGSSMMIESIEAFKAVTRKLENAICVVSGFVAGVLLAFNGYMWSQSVIVEVYPFSVLSLMGVVCCLMRWAYAPHQRRYAYMAWFLFGICFTNHQTLLLGAMGLEVVILMAQPKLGRDLMLGNSIVFIIGLIALKFKLAGSFELSPIVFDLYCGIGVLSMIACAWLTVATEKLGTEFLAVLIMFSLWVAGAAFYLYMPLTSMTNPPMNWGYPRTLDGFIHALTRGQYEKANPTNFLEHPDRLAMQLLQYFEGAVDEFNLVNLLIAVVPFLFILRMQKRERGWLIGLSAIWFCLAIILLIMLNPQPDKASKELNRVFFTASYTIIAIFVGYGLTLMAAFMATQYERFRLWGLCGSAIAATLALYSLVLSVGVYFKDTKLSFFGAIAKTFSPEQYGLPIHACLILIALPCLFGASLLIFRTKPAMPLVLGLFALLPMHSIMSHWADNEQRGHWFGYWFGHDMFTPPFPGPDGKLTYDPALREQAMKGTNGSLIYTEMARDAILFGGTDPGRFCPTYMIFCDSFVPHNQQPVQDQKFDRRDVYIITQNALADGTYLEYIRAHYNRSEQYRYDTPFFQSLFRGSNETQLNYTTNAIAKLAYEVLDRPLTAFGAVVEAARRREGVYPPKEIHTPTMDDSGRCFSEYIEDVRKRYTHDSNPQFKNEAPQMKPGENLVPLGDGKVTVSGQVSVMAINGLLTKAIFDANPTTEFYVEESFPLDWMYPYLTPFGVIMKLNRQPVAEMTENDVKRDHDFWSRYSDRLIGNWVTDDTPIKEIADFIERVYQRRDFTGFKGDPAFVRDDQAQKSFSKLRTSIGGVYDYRFLHPANGAEQQRMLKEADFAYRQAFAFCPYSPEAVFRYSQLLVRTGRFDDALLVAVTGKKMDPYNQAIDNLIKQITQWKASGAQVAPPINAAQVEASKAQLEKEVQDNPTNVPAALTLAMAYMQLGQTNSALAVMDKILTNNSADSRAIESLVQFYYEGRDFTKLEIALERLANLEPHYTATTPNAAQNWYNLAALRAFQGKTADALKALKPAMEENAKHLAADPSALNLQAKAASDASFNSLRAMPEFQQLVTPK
jgi:tetratricopeptide (TPR) repeat protein